MESLLAAYGALPGSQWHDEGDCAWFHSGVPFPVFNGIARASFSDADADRRIDEISARLSALGAPYHWFVPPTSRPLDLRDRLARKGIRHAADLSGMASSLSEIHDAEALEGFEARLVTDDAGVDDYVRIYTLLFGVPTEEWLPSLMPLEREFFRTDQGKYRRYVGWWNGQPVSAGMVGLEGGSAVLETLCTLPENRGRKFGSSLAMHALKQEALRGATEALVWAGPNAQVVYAQMGFRAVCEAGIYIA